MVRALAIPVSTVTCPAIERETCSGAAIALHILALNVHVGAVDFFELVALPLIPMVHITTLGIDFATVVGDPIDNVVARHITVDSSSAACGGHGKDQALERTIHHAL